MSSSPPRSRPTGGGGRQVPRFDVDRGANLRAVPTFNPKPLLAEAQASQELATAFGSLAKSFFNGTTAVLNQQIANERVVAQDALRTKRQLEKEERKFQKDLRKQQIEFEVETTASDPRAWKPIKLDTITSTDQLIMFQAQQSVAKNSFDKFLKGLNERVDTGLKTGEITAEQVPAFYKTQINEFIEPYPESVQLFVRNYAATVTSPEMFHAVGTALEKKSSDLQALEKKTSLEGLEDAKKSVEDSRTFSTIEGFNVYTSRLARYKDSIKNSLGEGFILQDEADRRLNEVETFSAESVLLSSVLSSIKENGVAATREELKELTVNYGGLFKKGGLLERFIPENLSEQQFIKLIAGPAEKLLDAAEGESEQNSAQFNNTLSALEVALGSNTDSSSLISEARVLAGSNQNRIDRLNNTIAQSSILGRFKTLNPEAAANELALLKTSSDPNDVLAVQEVEAYVNEMQEELGPGGDHVQFFEKHNQIAVASPMNWLDPESLKISVGQREQSMSSKEQSINRSGSKQFKFNRFKDSEIEGLKVLLSDADTEKRIEIINNISNNMPDNMLLELSNKLHKDFPLLSGFVALSSEDPALTKQGLNALLLFSTNNLRSLSQENKLKLRESMLDGVNIVGGRLTGANEKVFDQVFEIAALNFQVEEFKRTGETDFSRVFIDKNSERLFKKQMELLKGGDGGFLKRKVGSIHNNVLGFKVIRNGRQVNATQKQFDEALNGIDNQDISTFRAINNGGMFDANGFPISNKQINEFTFVNVGGGKYNLIDKSNRMVQRFDGKVFVLDLKEFIDRKVTGKNPNGVTTRILDTEDPDIMFAPVRGRITSKFGFRVDPVTKERKKHNGIDVAGKLNTNIRPMRKGKVVFSGPRNGFGNAIIVDHGNGLTSLYGHLNKTKVTVGQEVGRETVIGLMGKTGKTTGVHLHFQVTQNGEPQNPFNYVSEKDFGDF